MGAVTFDTLKFARSLRDAAGVPQEQAEGIALAFADAMSEQIATKADLKEMEFRLEAKIDQVDSKIDQVESRLIGDINLLKWMTGFMLALTSAVALKLFLH